MVLSIINKKERIDKDTGEKIIIYHCNDGVYSSLSNVIFDHFVVDNTNLFPFNERNEKKYKSIIFGPTCDSIDKIAENILLPELNVGQYVYLCNTGAYVKMFSPNSKYVDLFNGFEDTETKYVLN